MKKNNISILLTLRNVTKLVKKAVLGYMSQTEKPAEIVVVGLKKDLDMVKSAVNRNKKVKLKYIEFDGKKNDARNLAFANSEGSHVIIADYDAVPSKNLIEKCLIGADKFDALIIPEIGASKNDLKSRIFKLEKKVVTADEGSLTPRFFRKNLFNKRDLPFDSRFGVLDEWGFFVKLKRKKPKIGTADSHFTVYDELTYPARFFKNFKKGENSYKLFKVSKNAKKRLDPVKRGFNIFARNINNFTKQPVEFALLIGLKFIDLLFFMAGHAKVVASKKLNLK